MNGLCGVNIICLGPKAGFAGIRRAAENLGGDVRVVETLREFRTLETFRVPDLVFVWLFHDTQGLLKVLPLLKRQHRRVPVIVVTDRMNLDLYLNALTVGAFDALGVPVDEGELLRIARRALTESSSRMLPAMA